MKMHLIEMWTAALGAISSWRRYLFRGGALNFHFECLFPLPCRFLSSCCQRCWLSYVFNILIGLCRFIARPSSLAQRFALYFSTEKACFFIISGTFSVFWFQFCPQKRLFGLLMQHEISGGVDARCDFYLCCMLGDNRAAIQAVRRRFFIPPLLWFPILIFHFCPAFFFPNRELLKQRGPEVNANAEEDSKAEAFESHSHCATLASPLDGMKLS